VLMKPDDYPLSEKTITTFMTSNENHSLAQKQFSESAK